MLIKICGTESQIPDASSVEELLQTRNLSGDGVIIAVNDGIIKPEFWRSTKLNPNDDVEIIRIVCGG